MAKIVYEPDNVLTFTVYQIRDEAQKVLPLPLRLDLVETDEPLKFEAAERALGGTGVEKIGDSKDHGEDAFEALRIEDPMRRCDDDTDRLPKVALDPVCGAHRHERLDLGRPARGARDVVWEDICRRHFCEFLVVERKPLGDLELLGFETVLP